PPRRDRRDRARHRRARRAHRARARARTRLDLAPGVPRLPRALGARDGRLMLLVTSLRVEVAGRVLLADASFSVADGEKAAIVGRNGVGKTSLLSVVLGHPAAHVRHHGEVVRTGSVTYLPQVPVDR